LYQVLGVRVIPGSAKSVAVKQISQRNDFTFKPCTQLSIDRSALDWFADWLHPGARSVRGHCDPSPLGLGFRVIAILLLDRRSVDVVGDSHDGVFGVTLNTAAG
jgi:hypothetical protein